MSAKTSGFIVRSRHVARRFLQSAVIVDDQAHLDLQPRSVVKPGRQRPRSEAETEPPRGGPGAITHDLDAKLLIDAFAKLGVVCAVLKPVLALRSAEKNEASDTLKDFRARVDKATQRADIVILDWNIDEEPKPGHHAQLLIREILKTDESSRNARRNGHSRRLRLIAIYTGDEDLVSITDGVTALLESLDLGKVVGSRYCVRAGPVTIAVYGKGKPTIQSADTQRRVDEKELPSRLLDDFAEMTKGLLSNVALESLSAIRTNTHRILRRFNRTLDSAYIAHRAMMQPPAEAEEHPVPLIASEIEGVLADDRTILELVKLEAVKEWLDQLRLDKKVLPDEMDSEEFKAALISLLENGLQRVDVSAEHLRWAKIVNDLRSYERSAASCITDALSEDGSDGDKLDMEFAVLTSLRSRYEAPPPILRLGSIVATRKNGTSIYLLCIQPLCDSVRLNRPRKFPFLKLKQRQEGSENQFDFVVKDGQRFKRLYVSRKAYDIQTISMKPDRGSQCVEGKSIKDQWEFQCNGKGSPVRWLADLKPDFAHRIVTEFVRDVGRVGLTESEWLRRMARK